jgi:hypothetical protein
VVGTVVSMVTATSEYGSYPLITLDPGEPDPLVDVHCFHAWLKSDITRAALREGDTLAVKFLDRGGPRDAARYRVAVERTGTGPVYQPGVAAMGPSNQAEQLFEEPF